MTATVDTTRLATLPRQEPTPRPGWLLAILLTGQFMAILDVSIVNIAAPSIRTDLNASGAGLQLIVAGYTIAYAVLLITGARIGARRGYRQTYLFGLTLFTVASLACGFAMTSGQLIAFRFAQGAGAALMVPQILSLIQRNFDGAGRARALSIYAASIACGGVVGQVAGGLLVSADLFGTGWRPVFLVNVPVGLALLIAGRKSMPVDPGDSQRGLDLPGLAVLTPTVLAFIVPLVLGHEQGWPVWGWMLLALSGFGLAAFVAVERRVGRRGGSPLIPGRILGIRTVMAGVVILAGCFTIYGGWMFSLAVYVQSGLGHGPLDTGLMFLPGAVGFATASLTWRRLPEGWHRGLIPFGLAVATVSLVLLAALAGSAGLGGPYSPLLSTAFSLTGLGMGYAFSPVMSVALGEVAPADAANASGLLTTVLQLSQALGVAIFGTLYLSLVAFQPVPVAAMKTAWALAAVELATATAAFFLLFPPRSRAYGRDWSADVRTRSSTGATGIRRGPRSRRARAPAKPQSDCPCRPR
jgi:MFS family permease